jgi:3-oxoacyl-[acyl-carrier-protein] synthase-3
MNVCVATRALRVQGTGAWLPPQVETAADLAPRIGRSAAWIESRTGVRERRVSSLPMEQMAASAAREALGDGPPPDLVVNASLTPVQLAPDSSVFILRELGLDGVPGFSLHATCLSFLDALPVVAGLVGTGGFSRVLVVSAERGTRCRRLDEPESAALIGDGAGAVVLGPDDGSGSALLGTAMATWPEGAHLAEIPGFGDRNPPGADHTLDVHNRFSMSGPAIYRLARQRLPELLDALLGGLGMTPDDIDIVVPHQASGPGVLALARFGFPLHKVVQTVDWTGNCIAASVPIALHHACQTGRIRRGSTVMLLGTGAGLSATAAVLRW